ncbi:MAG: transcriptional regulator, LysR family [Massilia sp.]|nr:transcriptional regulator, LysR family [Massilia sp.]
MQCWFWFHEFVLDPILVCLTFTFPSPSTPTPPSNKPDAAAPMHAFSALRMVCKLRLNQLLIVDSVLQIFSFAVTAQNLGMTQSAVTKAVQHLESFFETKLFERTNRGVRPTEPGL